MRRLLCTFAICLASVVGLAGAAAASSWTVQTLPAPVVPSGQLSGVSCPSVKFCMAVGGGPDGPLAEVFTSAGWSLLRLPGGGGGGLRSVSCSSATACTAIGSVTTAIGSGSRFVSATLVERWNGRRWLVQPLAAPADTTLWLNGVSCPLRKLCFAVGVVTSPKRRAMPLVERWNGSTWSVQRAASRGLRPSVANSLYGVSCASAKACVAVGATFGKSLVERWNGSTWRFLKSAPQVFLSAVTCRSATNCTAVGNGSGRAVAETLNGSKQSVQPLADPGGEPDSAHFSSVACTSAKACLAVGFFYPDSGSNTGPLIERWSHGRWSLLAVRTAQAGQLGGVSCPARRSCTAVGNLSTASTSYTWALHGNGSSFASQSTPNETAPASVELNAVSCASSTACTAVGDYTDVMGFRRTLAEVWNGVGWSIQATPSPSNGVDSQLNSVSCPTATACIAVGFISSGQQLAEYWDGVGWTIQRTPDGSAVSTLNSISCSSPTACMAIGSGPNGPLAERWDGGSWVMQDAPQPPAGSQSENLRGVSCTASTACTVVGQFEAETTVPCGPSPVPGQPPTQCSGSVSQTLAEAWDGTSWSIQATPTPSGGGQLNDVSCTSATACIAVGYSYTSTTATLAEAWDGTSWSIHSVPSPPAGGFLSGVSCASPSDCAAVGNSSGSRGPFIQLADVWDGTTWSPQTLPSPAGATISSLSAVSCTSATVCTAVGTVGTAGLGTNTSTPIAVRSS